MAFDDLSVIQGEELFIDYGRKTDCFYLCNFGFVDFGTNKEEFKMILNILTHYRETPVLLRKKI